MNIETDEQIPIMEKTRLVLIYLESFGQYIMNIKSQSPANGRDIELCLLLFCDCSGVAEEGLCNSVQRED